LLPQARSAHSQIAHTAPATWARLAGCELKPGTGYGWDEREQDEGQSADDRLAPPAKPGKEQDADNRGNIKPRTVPAQHATACLMRTASFMGMRLHLRSLLNIIDASESVPHRTQKRGLVAHVRTVHQQALKFAFNARNKGAIRKQVRCAGRGQSPEVVSPMWQLGFSSNGESGLS
jgi:hypothetical protein